MNSWSRLLGVLVVLGSLPLTACPGKTRPDKPGPGDVIPASERVVMVGWRHQGHPAENEYLDELGWAVAVADLDGDGREDIVAGAPGESLPTHAQVGEVRAFLSSGDVAAVDKWHSASSRGVWQRLDTAWVKSSFRSQGRSVAAADLDGDGRAEVLLGAPGWDDGNDGNTGRVGWLRGIEAAPDDRALGPIDPSRHLYGAPAGSWRQTERISMQELGLAQRQDQAQLGWSIATGDFDGDGRVDVAAGAPRLGLTATNTPNRNEPGVRGGGVLVIAGRLLPDGGDGRVLGQGGSGDGNEPDDRFGWALAVGDFDGNGVDDLAVGAPHDDDESIGAEDVGKVYVFYGRKVGLPGAGLATVAAVVLDPRSAGARQDTLRGALFGRALTAGDLDGDGADELIVGAPLLRTGGRSSVRAGGVFVYPGAKGGGLAANRATVVRQGGSDDQQGDHFGHALAAGRLDADLFGDLVVGAPLEDAEPGLSDSGAVFVYRGGPGGVDVATRAPQKLRLRDLEYGPRPGDRLGWSVATGDLDGDGLDELVVGAPYRVVGPPHVPADEPGVARDAGIITIWQIPR